jgi:hypothetical protein
MTRRKEEEYKEKGIEDKEEKWNKK